MNSGKISIRYARALLMSANEKKVSETVYNEMIALGKVFEDFPQMKNALASPTVSDAEKQDLIISSLVKPSKETAAFIKFVIDEKREDYLPAIARMYEKLYREENKIVISNLTAATDLSKEAIEAIKRYIADLSGSVKVEIRTQTDESLIGGFVLDIEDTRLDASIKEQLKKLEYYAGN